jgi:hypothetical protein
MRRRREISLLLSPFLREPSPVKLIPRQQASGPYGRPSLSGGAIPVLQFSENWEQAVQNVAAGRAPI